MALLTYDAVVPSNVTGLCDGEKMGRIEGKGPL